MRFHFLIQGLLDIDEKLIEQIREKQEETRSNSRKNSGCWKSSVQKIKITDNTKSDIELHSLSITQKISW